MRRPRPIVALASLALVAGCSGEASDPARTRLAPGSGAIVAAPPGASIYMVVPKTGKPYGDGFAYPEGGDLVVIESDDAEPKLIRGIPTKDAPPAPQIDADRQFDARPVRVTVLDGIERGKVGTLPRWALRSSPARQDGP